MKTETRFLLWEYRPMFGSTEPDEAEHEQAVERAQQLARELGQRVELRCWPLGRDSPRWAARDLSRTLDP